MYDLVPDHQQHPAIISTSAVPRLSTEVCTSTLWGAAEVDIGRFLEGTKRNEEQAQLNVCTRLQTGAAPHKQAQPAKGEVRSRCGM